MTRGWFGAFGRGKKPVPPSVKPTAIPVGKPTYVPSGQQKPVALPEPMLLGRSEFPDGTRTTAPYPHTMGDAFLAGTMTYLTSSWLKAFKYDRKEKKMRAWFLDGYACTVPNFSEELALKFYSAPSKGGAWWDYVLGPNYVHGQRHTAAMQWVDGV